jgi:hypothetical protein
LPFNDFGYDDNLNDNYESIRVFINDIEWSRIKDFYDKLSGLTNELNVYMFNYDKNNQYILEFSPSRNIPNSTDKIELWLLESLGSGGNVKANSVKLYGESPIIWNITDSVWESNDKIYNIYNVSSIVGGENPQAIEDIKESSKTTSYRQHRNVSKLDYIYYLEDHPNVYAANVWGEKEQNPDGGNFYDYNKVYISLIPTKKFENWTNKLNYVTYETDKDEIIYIPVENYTYDYKTLISTYLEPYKIIGSYEQYVIPNITYFSFNFTIYIKNNYKFNEVLADFKRKLQYYFENNLNQFGKKINYTDMIYELENPSYTSQTDSFIKTQGIKKVVIRSIKYFDNNTFSWLDINDFESGLYPQWDEIENTSDWDYNVLRNIIINNNQFPTISLKHCNFEQGI